MARRIALDFTAEDLISGMVSVKEMSGPVGIVSVIAETGESAASTSEGLMNVAYLGAFIAVNLAVMNMLPLPALDGGRIFLLLVNTLFTAVTKKKIPSKYEAWVHAAGMILLLGFMALVTFKDVCRGVLEDRRAYGRQSGQAAGRHEPRAHRLLHQAPDGHKL